jgi:RNase P subunit RPR2
VIERTGARRPKGSGSVYRRKDGRWVASYLGTSRYCPSREAAEGALVALHRECVTNLRKTAKPSKPPRQSLGNSVRFQILERDGFACTYCGGRAPQVRLHVDHILPVSGGGTDDPTNLVTSCSDCNHGKRDRLLSQEHAEAIATSKVVAHAPEEERFFCPVCQAPLADSEATPIRQLGYWLEVYWCRTCRLPAFIPFKKLGDSPRRQRQKVEEERVRILDSEAARKRRHPMSE